MNFKNILKPLLHSNEAINPGFAQAFRGLQRSIRNVGATAEKNNAYVRNVSKKGSIPRL